MAPMSRSRPRHMNTLAALRRQHGLSQTQAARLLGCRKRQQIARYERGERLPSLPKAACFAAAYRVPLSELFPALFMQARRATEQRWQMIRRLRQPKPYDPPPNSTTVLALYPGTRKMGMAVFAALPPRQGVRAHL